MSISYAKLNEDIDFGVKEVEIIGESKEYDLGKSIKKFFVDTRCVIEDKDGNRWIYSPNTDRYYLYFDKKSGKHTMTCYPTVGSIINPNCKMGLRMYEKASAGAKTVKRFSIDDTVQVTSHFRIDDNGTIWIYSVTLDDRKQPKDITDGWLIYKNSRNNFVNLLFRNNIEVVTTNGELDPKKVKEFGNALFQLKSSYQYFGRNFLQFFAEPTSGKDFNIQVPVGLKNSQNKIVTIGYIDEETYSVYGGKRPQNSNYATKFSNKATDNILKTKNNFRTSVADITHHRPKIVQNSKKFPSTGNKKSPYK